MINAVIPLVNGVEEMEAVITADVLRRAQWDVVTAGLQEGVVTASRGMQLVPDHLLDDLDPDQFDLLVIPGGSAGVERLCRSELLKRWVSDFGGQGKRLAAICAGPKVLAAAGVLTGHRYTCFPGGQAEIHGAEWVDEPFVADGVIFTSQAAGTTFLFALRLIELIESPEKAQRIARGMYYDYRPMK